MAQRQDFPATVVEHVTRARIASPALRLTLLVSAALVLGSCATFPGSGPPLLQDEVDRIVSTPPLDQVNWGIRIIDPDRGRILYNRNAHRKFVPASNMKLLATSTALSLLGSEFRYETGLWGVGRAEDGGATLDGDLVLLAAGDPTLSDRFYPSAEAPLDSLAQRLWDGGLRRVSGALVVDVSAWDSTTVPGSWMVRNLAGTSGATGGAFAIAEGELTIEVTGGRAPGEPARTRWWPHTDDDFVSVAYVTVDPDSSTRARRIDYLPESRHLRVSGLVHAGEVDTIRIAQRDPVRLASAALLRALQRRGIQVEGGLRIAWDPGEPVGPADASAGWAGAAPRSGSLGARAPGPGTDGDLCVTGRRGEQNGGQNETRVWALPACSAATRLAVLRSPPLAEIVQGILEPSQNWMTEQLVRTLGMERGRRGSWSEGFEVEQDFLVHGMDVDSLDITYMDGSGLSAYNLVTPRAIVRILEHMRASSMSGIYRNALASPGEEDSTLENRLLGVEGRLFAKTGTITHVNSLSGYLFTDNGSELVFSILTNGSGLPSSVVRTGMDRIVEAMRRY